MKFGEKYELLESLTTGAVETFAANDKTRGERVLVHILDCPPQKPNQSTMEWVLESFRRMAPEPVGTVLESGKYSGTQYAYLVTKPPDEAAVKSWVRRYEIQRLDTQETGTRQVKPAETAVEASIPPAPQVRSPERAPVPGSMTQLFHDFDSQAKEKEQQIRTPQIPPPRETPPRPLPATSLPGSSGLHAAPPWDPVNVRASTPDKREEPSFSTPSNSLPSDFAGKSAPPEPSVGAINDRSKPGEFTSFFQGPFRGEASSDMPVVTAQPIEPPRKRVGEFTAVFGQVTPPDQAPSEPAGNAGTGPSFTGLFKDMEGARKPINTSTPLPGSVLSTPVQPVPAAPPPKDLYSSPQAPIFVAPTPLPPVLPSAVSPIPIPQTPVEKAVVRPGNLPGGAATGAFTRPTSEPAPVQPEVQSGPSPYTQIISRASFTPEAGAEEAAPSKAGGGVKLPAASMPKIPAMAPPPMPKMPPPPPIPPPAMPKIAAPAAPKVPKVGAPTPPPVSYWPLIITLTVLFFLAVLLVLYFALKH